MTVACVKMIYCDHVLPSTRRCKEVFEVLSLDIDSARRTAVRDFGWLAARQGKDYCADHKEAHIVRR